MADAVKICNLALSWLGQNRITSLDENKNEARVMSANFDLSRDYVLEDANWTFAMTRKVLVPTTGAPAFGDENLFQIPTDIIRVFRCFPASTAAVKAVQQAEWKREGRYILSNESKLWMVGVERIVNTDFFSPQFAHALAARIAADTAITFTENRNLKNDMEAMYMAKLNDATASDGSQGRNETIQSNRLTGARTR